MLYVKFPQLPLVQARIGEEVFCAARDHLVDLAVNYVQADGDELERIHRWGYPNHGGIIQTYVGDAARQIVINW